MESLYDYRKYAVRYVDDEEMSLKYFSRAFQAQFQILTAANAKEAYQLLEQQRDKIALIMTDQRMPGEQGVQFLGRARQLHPAAIRILTTAYSVPFLWSQRIVALPVRVKGWNMTPSHYLSQDLVDVWLDR